MKHLLRILPVTVVSAMTLTGCIDNNYDLADLDTTSEFKVNNLAIPLKVDAITLDSLITMSDDSPIKVLTDADGSKYYAIQKGGEFHSKGIEVGGFDIAAPKVKPTTATFKVGDILENFDNPLASKRRRAKRVITIPGTSIEIPDKAPAWQYTFENSQGSTVAYSARDIDESVKAVTYLAIKPMTIAMTVTLKTDNSNYFTNLKDLQLQIIDGFDVEATSEGATYDKKTGRLNISKIKFNDKGEGNVWLRIKGLDFASAGIVINPDHSVNINKEFNLMSATAEIGMKQSYYDSYINEFKDKVQAAIMSGQLPPEFKYPDPPTTVTYGIDYTVPNMVADHVSGELEYRIDGLNIAPVALTDIPDFLNDPQNNLRLYNPQIYISMDKNPVAYAGKNGLGFATGLCLTANRLDNSKEFKTTGDGLVVPGKTEGPFYYCISAVGAENIPAGFGNAATYAATATYNGKKVLHNITIPTLGDIVSGQGLPQSIGIELTNTAVWQQKVDQLQLPLSLPEVNGAYEFICPLALRGASADEPASEGSVLIYSEESSGWNLNILDDLTVRTIKIKADLTSDLPLGAHLSATPLDKEGNPITGLTVKGSDFPADCTDAPIEIVVDGDMKDLDGIKFTATVTPAKGNTKPISPSQKIQLNKLRIVVDGAYNAKLKK